MASLLHFYIGTYTTPILFGSGEKIRAEGEGIYRFSYDPSTRVFTPAAVAAKTENPSFVTRSPSGRYLYAVNELPEWEGRASGGVSSFLIDPETRDLALLNQRPSEGTDPCHICVSEKESHLFVSNFMSGSLSIFPLKPDGSLGPCRFFSQHRGKSLHPVRQASPHVHSVVFPPAGDLAYVSDLGLDRVMVYGCDFSRETFAQIPGLSLDAPPGSGPRHCVFSPSGVFCYVVCELSSSILVWGQKENGFILLQTLSTLPEGFSGRSTCADVLLSPDGAFLWATNRGHDSIVLFKRDPETGLLEKAGFTPSGGVTPRSFMMDPSGQYLAVANQESDNVVLFSVEEKTGLLHKEGEVSIPSPSCVCLYRS